MPDNIIDLDARRVKTVLVGENEGEQTLITCDYGAALIMRIYEDGDVSQLSLNGEAMDKLCQIWSEYKQLRKGDK
jgi:hypothetical protein